MESKTHDDDGIAQSGIEKKSITNEADIGSTVNDADLRLDDLTDGKNERGIPAARFIEDITGFSKSFLPVPASAELLIGAYTQLHTRYKSSEQSLKQKRTYPKPY
jgi:hypothetical protein